MLPGSAYQRTVNVFLNALLQMNAQPSDSLEQTQCAGAASTAQHIRSATCYCNCLLMLSARRNSAAICGAYLENLCGGLHRIAAFAAPEGRTSSVLVTLSGRR